METNGTTKKAALIVATLSSFLGPFMGSSINVALPSIGHEFFMGAILLGWVNTAYLLAGAMVSLMRQTGMMFSMGVVMMVLAVLMGDSEIVSENQFEFIKSIRISYAVFAVMCFGGIFASLARGKLKRS